METILRNSRRHDISFHPSGKIDISAHIARRLTLTPGDVIGIAREDGEWYLYVRLRAGQYQGRHEGRVWATAHGKGTFRTASKTITRTILQAAGTETILRCPCGAEFERDNKTYITIIYRCSL